MSKLIFAGFNRLFKNKLFWICSATMLAIGLALPFVTDKDTKLERIFFVFTIIVGIFSAVFTGLFIGTEYGDGTMKNKLIIGHSRVSIYLSNLFICAVAGIFMQICFTLAICAVGIPRLGMPELKFSVLFFQYFISILSTVAFAAIYTMFGMLISTRSIGVVISILLAIFLTFFAVYCNSSLHEPAYFDSYSYSDSSGNTIHESESPNPHYLSGTKREIYQFIYDFQPMGQSLQLTTLEMTNLNRLPLYSIAIILLTTGGGLIFFRKKDIK